MYRLTIENFQSIKGPLTLEIDGLTCVLGKSNIGKSAIVRALTALLTNRRGSNYITSGQDHCRVVLEFKDHSVEWLRTKTTAEYVIDGKRYAKLNGDVPDELYRLGFGPFMVGKDQHWPQIHGQHDSPFALRETPATTAALLGVNEEARWVVQAGKAVQKIHQNAKREESFLSDKLHAQNTLVEQSRSLRESISRSKDALQVLEEKKTALQDRADRLARLRLRYMELEPRTGVSVKDPRPVPGVNRVQNLTKTLRGYSYYSGRCGVEPPVVPDSPVFPESLVEMTRTLRGWGRLPKSFPEINMEVRVPEYDYLVESLAELRTGYLNAQSIWSAKQQELERSQGELDRVEREIAKAKARLAVCPLCGGVMGDHSGCQEKS